MVDSTFVDENPARWCECEGPKVTTEYIGSELLVKTCLWQRVRYRETACKSFCDPLSVPESVCHVAYVIGFRTAELLASLGPLLLILGSSL